MAIVLIRGRDGIQIANERAHKLKEVMLAYAGNKKEDALVDLGTWMGRVSQIKSIEMEYEKLPMGGGTDTFQAKVQAHEEEVRRLHIGARAKLLGFFKLCYARQIGNYARDSVPAEILEKAEDAQLEYYREHPQATEVPRDVFVKAGLLEELEKPLINHKSMRPEAYAAIEREDRKARKHEVEDTRVDDISGDHDSDIPLPDEPGDIRDGVMGEAQGDRSNDDSGSTTVDGPAD